MGQSRRSREIADAAQRHRASADRVLDRTAMVTTRRTYEEEHGEVVRAVTRAVPGPTQRTATASEVRRAEAALREQTHHLLGRMERSFHETTRDTLTESARATARFIARVEGDRGTVLHDDDTIRRIVSRHSGAVSLARTDAMRSLRDQMNAQVVARMRGLGDVSRGDLIATASSVIQDNHWRIERTIRTETSFALNRAQGAAIHALAEDFPDIRQRWTEMVSDLTGAPLDNRVGEDSLVLHGQVAKIGEYFTMPSDPRAGDMVGMSWDHPPNRPNDRAVLMPWRPEWGMPSYEMRGGQKHPLR